MSVMTLLSRVLGLARDVVFAGLFGASGGADAFFVAFKIPNFLRRLFGEGAFAQAFVPVLAEYMAKPEGARALVAATAGVLFTLLAVLTLVVLLFVDQVVWVFAPGFASDPAKLALAGDLLTLTFPYLFFIAGVAFAGGILNAHERFAVPAFTPVLLNLSLIGAALLLAPQMQVPVMALGWGVLLAGALQWTFQIPFLLRIGMAPRPRWQPSHPGVKQIGTLMLPALFGVGVSQINLLLDTVLASFLVTGSVSWLYYSDRLVELPLGVIGIAIATVILPKLSHAFTAGQSEKAQGIQDWGLGLCFILGAPATVALMLLAEPLLYTLFQYGAMQPSDVQQAALSLRAYALGLIPFMAIKVLAPGFFSRQDTRTPVRIAIIAMTANMALNLALIGPLAHVGLALATSVSAGLNATLLYVGLHKMGAYRLGRMWLGLVAQVAIATALMAGSLVTLSALLPGFETQGLGSRVWQMAALVATGAMVFAGALILVGFKPRQWLGMRSD